MFAVTIDNNIYATFETEADADAFLARHFNGTEGQLAVIAWEPE